MHLSRPRWGIGVMLLTFALLAVATLWMAGCASAPPPHAREEAGTGVPAAKAPKPAGPSRSPASESSATPEPAPPPPPAPRPPLEGLTGPTHVLHAHAAQPAESSTPNEYALGDAVESWKNSLRTGGIEYQVPPGMVAQVPSTVTVNIHGYQDAKSQALTNPTGTDQLKVSSKMKVELYAPSSPGEFAIQPTSGDAVQFVPNDGYATWTWNVTPQNEAAGQQLAIRVSLVYQQGSNPPVTQIIEEKTYTVSVSVQKLTTTVLESFWKDPLAWFKYVLPGGAGWGALAALVGAIGGLGIWKKRAKKKTKAAPKKDAVAP